MHIIVSIIASHKSCGSSLSYKESPFRADDATSQISKKWEVTTASITVTSYIQEWHVTALGGLINGSSKLYAMQLELGVS